MPAIERTGNGVTSTEHSETPGELLSTEAELAIVEGFVGRYSSTVDGGVCFTVILDESQGRKFHKMNMCRGIFVRVARMAEAQEYHDSNNSEVEG